MRTHRLIPAALLVAALGSTSASSISAQGTSPLPPPAPGQVVWWDLLTEDADAVLDFYRELFGWQISEHTDRHWVVSHRGHPIAGISRIRSDHPEVEEAFWLAGIAVTDVDAAVAAARDLGATVHIEPRDSAGYARFAVVSDSEGVPVMLLDPFRDLGGVRGVGGWAWAELWARDPDAAARFYRRVVGLERQQTSVAGGSYDVLASAGGRRAGLVKVPSDRIDPAWAPYLEVADLSTTLIRVAELGGSVLVEPRRLQSVGSVALVADPAGAAFFLYQRPGDTEVR